MNNVSLGLSVIMFLLSTVGYISSWYIETDKVITSNVAKRTVHESLF